MNCTSNQNEATQRKNEKSQGKENRKALRLLHQPRLKPKSFPFPSLSTQHPSFPPKTINFVPFFAQFQTAEASVFLLSLAQMFFPLSSLSSTKKPTHQAYSKWLFITKKKSFAWLSKRRHNRRKIEAN